MTSSAPAPALSFGRSGPIGRETPVLWEGDRAFDLRALTSDIDGAFLAAGGVARARKAHAAGELPVLDDATALRRGAPVARPGKVVCIGLNYRDHAAETGAPIPAEPIVFMKDPDTVIGPDDEVLIPRDSTKTDWEVELAVVIGSTARYLGSPDDARAVIAGYAISNDVSEREFQLERGGQWDKGKSCETFNPLGPVLVPDLDVSALRLHLRVDGEPRQHGSTADMVFDPAYIVWYLSRFMVLRPGDVINTGTPAGVALGLPGTPYLRPGQVIEVEIDGLGRQRQTVGQA